MRCISKKTNSHTIKTLKVFLLLITFSTRSEVVKGQISAMGAHHPEYEVAPSLHNGANTNRDDDDLNNASNGLNSNGEILAPKSPPLSAQEPTCEELRAMWIFSKRQSRAAEISNEIPTYRDPFAYNIWEPIYPSSRSIGSRMISPFRETSRPVFGRVISREPVVLQRYPGRARFFEDVSRMYGSESRSAVPALPVGLGPRRYMQYRFSGSPVAAPQISTSNNPNALHQGSFQKLKDLIWTERAKELNQQRRAEEMEARAAALKEITAGERYHTHQEQRMGSNPADENFSPDQDLHYQHNTDSRLSASYPESVVIKSIFSGNPQSNTGRTARVVIPNMIGDVGEHDSVQNLQMRPSHFRERNRALFRKSMPTEYYQRNTRNERLRVNNDVTDTNELSSMARFSSSTNNMGDIADSPNYRYRSSLLFNNKHQSTGMQQQLEDLYNNILQLDKIVYPTVYHQRKLNYGNNAIIEANRRNRRDNFSNDYSELSYSSDNNNLY